MNQTASIPVKFPKTSKTPKSRGRIMDFTPRKPIIAAKPTTKPVIKMPAPQSAPQTITQARVVTYSSIRKHPLSHPTPVSPTPQPQPTPKPKPQPKPQPEPEPQPTPLGTRSPFFKKSVAVEKRPLSGGTAKPTRPQASHPAIADYSRPQLTRSSVIKPVSRKSKLPLVLLIAGTILVGAAVGACAYFLVFQGE